MALETKLWSRLRFWHHTGAGRPASLPGPPHVPSFAPRFLHSLPSHPDPGRGAQSPFVRLPLPFSQGPKIHVCTGFQFGAPGPGKALTALERSRLKEQQELRAKAFRKAMASFRLRVPKKWLTSQVCANIFLAPARKRFHATVRNSDEVWRFRSPASVEGYALVRRGKVIEAVRAPLQNFVQ